MKLHKSICIKCVNERHEDPNERWNSESEDIENWEINHQIECGKIYYPNTHGMEQDSSPYQLYLITALTH